MGLPSSDSTCYTPIHWMERPSNTTAVHRRDEVPIVTTAQPMSPAAPTFPTTRLAAIGALGFAAGVAIQNFVLLIGMPDTAAAPSDVAAWLTENRSRSTMASAIVGFNMPLLLVFAAAARALVRDVAAARLWVDLGAFAAIVLVGLFGIVASTQIAATLIADGGATPAFIALWMVHNAAFALAMTAVGVALLGFAVGMHVAGLTPAWQRTMGLVGATLLLVTGLANAAVASGSPIIYVGLGGFGLWLVWLVATGARLLR